MEPAMDKLKPPNSGAREKVVTVQEGGDLLEELVSAATVEEVKVIEAKARAAREVIASIGEQLQPFAPAASAPGGSTEERARAALARRPGRGERQDPAQPHPGPAPGHGRLHLRVHRRRLRAAGCSRSHRGARQDD